MRDNTQSVLSLRDGVECFVYWSEFFLAVLARPWWKCKSDAIKSASPAILVGFAAAAEMIIRSGART